MSPAQPEEDGMARIKVGDTVVIEAKVSHVSKDGSEVTIRIPHYGYPVTVPVNSVAGVVAKPAKQTREPEPKDPIQRGPKPRGKLAKLLGDEA